LRYKDYTSKLLGVQFSKNVVTSHQLLNRFCNIYPEADREHGLSLVADGCPSEPIEERSCMQTLLLN
jgi:hypothetical protein